MRRTGFVVVGLLVMTISTAIPKPAEAFTPMCYVERPWEQCIHVHYDIYGVSSEYGVAVGDPELYVGVVSIQFGPQRLIVLGYGENSACDLWPYPSDDCHVIVEQGLGPPGEGALVCLYYADLGIDVDGGGDDFYTPLLVALPCP